MKRVATLILNRNLPRVTEQLYEKLVADNGDVSDFYVVESGSQRDNLCKYQSWWANWDEALETGLRYPRGFNFGLHQLLLENKYEKYDFFYLVCNDAEFPQEPVIAPLLELMEKHRNVGILSPCSPDWGEAALIGPDKIKYFWYLNQVSWLLRRQYVDDVRETQNPSFMNFLYDGSNFRGYESDIELIAKGYVNDWATAITTRVQVLENKSHLITKADLIKTEPYEESVAMCVREGREWMRRKYGFNSRWQMQLYAKFFYERFFEYHPHLGEFRI
jgi:hypothetical protein